MYASVTPVIPHFKLSSAGTCIKNVHQILKSQIEIYIISLKTEHMHDLLKIFMKIFIKIITKTKKIMHTLYQGNHQTANADACFFFSYVYRMKLDFFLHEYVKFKTIS